MDHFRRCRERSRFVRGLVAWTGFRQTAVLFDRQERYAGRTKYGLFRLIVLALDTVVGFSSVPVRLASMLGFLVCIVSLILSLKIFFEKLISGIPVSGYALLVTGMFFLGGVQLFVLGLIGEYIARIYRESQRRPLYIIAEKSTSLPPGYEGAFVGHSHGSSSSPPSPADSQITDG